MNHIHVCWTNYSIQEVRTMDCYTCGTIQRMLCQFQDWYGWTITCLTCGEQWQDGERVERPFMRGWRKLAIEAANNKARELGLL